jgi:phospholipid-binding lipoprotein MlaA
MFSISLRAGIAVAATTLLLGCAHSPPGDPQDPFESVNRGIYKFNDTADRYAVRPLAKGYRKVTPDPVEKSIGNFFTNIRYPITIVNDILQLKPAQTVNDIGRFLINTTFGVAGLFDVASYWGVPRNDEDFGQTLGYWGLGQGAYLVLPFLGPSTGRDAIGQVADGFTNPMSYIQDEAVRYSLYALYFIDLRASLLGLDQAVYESFDPYIFVRDAYLSDRLDKVYDGDVPPEKIEVQYDDDFYDTE